VTSPALKITPPLTPAEEFNGHFLKARTGARRKSARQDADGRFFHPDGKARFVFETPRPLREEPTVEFPLLLLTGRGNSAQWHTGTRTEKSAVLCELRPAAAYVEINPFDAEKLGITSGANVRVSSRRGCVLASAFVTQTIPRGNVFMPMHYGGTNVLTLPAFDPYSGQPAYKACAVNVTVADFSPK
jgi:assimilatory nitrate reductase catalytic subunit